MDRRTNAALLGGIFASIASLASLAVLPHPARADGSPAPSAPPAVSASPAPSASPSPPEPSAAPTAHAQTVLITIVGADGALVACREQTAQPFLVRGNWFKGGAAEAKKGQALLADAIRYRTEKYGYFPGFGQASWNAHPPRFYAEGTTFMGMALQVNKRIVPALKCVEAALKASPAHLEYHPRSAGGIRFANTYRGSEVSNHVYGIAIDIEPDRNTCCGCVPPWNKHPRCAKKGTPYDRMDMPRSWVTIFERYGFYWLGHDVLQDTMHFEFLGDPDQITAPVSAEHARN